MLLLLCLGAPARIADDRAPSLYRVLLAMPELPLPARRQRRVQSVKEGFPNGRVVRRRVQLGRGDAAAPQQAPGTRGAAVWSGNVGQRERLQGRTLEQCLQESAQIAGCVRGIRHGSPKGGLPA